VNHVYCVCDGIELYFQKAGDYNIQGEFYSGKEKKHCVTNIFIFVPDGRMVFTILNAPGSIHESTLCDMNGLYDTLNDKFNRTNGRCAMDSAFRANGNPSVLRTARPRNRVLTQGEEEFLKQAKKLRYSAEWGMRAIRSSFPRVNDTIRYEENGFRGLFLECMTYLYNFRVVEMEMNQIRSVYVKSIIKEPQTLF
jgi:DDE superfamily endonuclease